MFFSSAQASIIVAMRLRLIVWGMAIDHPGEAGANNQRRQRT
jgi:hypothetical protein